MRIFNAFRFLGLVGVSLFLVSCNSSPDALFKLHAKEDTGIDFANTIFESDSFNIFTYDYIYNGGGVATADFNNDGLTDLFFTGNMVPNKLYLNAGEFRFKDVSQIAQVNLPDHWNSGVTVVDINNDGWQDIYVCSTMKADSLLRRNMLFLNKGVNKDNVPVFQEVAGQYGIADDGFSVMAAFFDYDLDNDLDLYVLTNKDVKGVSSNYRPKITDGSSPTTDRLYRNNSDGTFTNVSKQAGIRYEGYGLGLAISDFNNDGWPDIYESNDFTTNDVLYINNHDGTFTNQSPQRLAHQSLFSMGNDASDFNNDNRTDLVTMDMLPETNQRKKTMINNKNYLTYINNEKFHYEYQFMRNMLQVNNGDSLRFSEVGQMAGVYQTEWSWSPLFADFDNDGWKDLAVTNGFPRDITDRDFIAYRADVGSFVPNRQLIDSIPVVKIPNYIFRNNGDLTFKDVSKEWGFVQPSFSNGAAFADLDNDGDLDYVVNNINDEAFVYENTLYKGKERKSEAHFLRLKLIGPTSNKPAYGAKVKVYDGGKTQYFDYQVSRGYLSAVEGVIHVGLGQATVIDSIIVRWPDGRTKRIEKIDADQVLTVKYDSSDPVRVPAAVEKSSLVNEVAQHTGLNYKHAEEDQIDYNIQRTLPHKFTQSGPGISVGDVDNDQLEDIIVGSSVGHSPSIFLQRPNGTFSTSYNKGLDKKKEEDEGLLLFDADGDKDLDIYIVSGGMESDAGSPMFQDRLYFNDGKGRFKLDTLALPAMRASGSCVRASDWDADGDLDLFVGGRVVPASYPFPAESYLLQNDHGRFTDVTQQIGGEDIAQAGMVTDALFTDFDNDKNTDLILVGEFMPISLFRNAGGKFVRTKETGLENKRGWWNSITGADFDGDGDCDYIAGNFGLNNSYHVSAEFPMKVFAKDFDKNGSIDAILSCYIKESLENKDTRNLYPIHFWDELNSQSPRFRRQFSRYKHYAKATVDKLFTPEELKEALVLEANYFESSYIENLGQGKFKITPLPVSLQIAPVNGVIVDDVNLDGNPDVIMVGNDYGNEVFAGRSDAFTGLVLLGNGKGDFRVVPSSESGFYVPGDAKALVRLSSAQGDLYIATRNRDSLKVFSPVKKASTRLFQPESTDVSADLIYSDGKKQRVEFYYGSGYLSQSTRKLKIPGNVIKLVVYDSKGTAREIKLENF